MIRGLQAWAAPHRAVDIDRAPAMAADEVVVVVIDPLFVASRRAGRLDAADEAFVGQGTEGVVHRLTRDGTDISPHELLDLVRRAVRPARHRPQDGQTLSRHLNTVLAEEVRWVTELSAGHK